MQKTLLFTFLFLLSKFSFAQQHTERFTSIDVLHYTFDLHLNDSSKQIRGETSVFIRLLKPADTVQLDFIGMDDSGIGMIVNSVSSDEQALVFLHENNNLQVEVPESISSGDTVCFKICYTGIPADGLVISENKHGQRTFFGDNWPDRAKHWLPTVDHPSDKATLEFLIYAPQHYEVVSNGKRVEKKQLPNNIEFTHWREDVPISTKLMVIGVADFLVGNNENYQGVPISSWIFRHDKETGFNNYKYGTKALAYFSALIGPYSYEKLAHVQSKTRYGGMENASCIFYHERTATSPQSQERLFAHEVAHQWFGNSVTEQNWHHLWLSEGFATYLTHVYMQHFYGNDLFNARLKNDRERVIAYSNQNLAPIIDTTVTDYIRLLNTNSYEKASWFLHMLRAKLGDDIFFKGLQKYYRDYKNSTALTTDFQKVIEAVSGKKLDYFFTQWLWQAGHPVLNYTWGETKQDNYMLEQHISINQNTNQLFAFPLEVLITYEDGSSELKYTNFDGVNSNIRVQVKTTSPIKSIQLDPEVKLLFELAQTKM
ncbi:M1 family metallopeptidase [uncultured Draconibacterium sp.]|uniref:M1 family metallopeptidase n=1 Tax=uncultured Draconibacterium sp. TaxID=1573823 RepID=UPI003260CC56